MKIIVFVFTKYYDNHTNDKRRCMLMTYLSELFLQSIEDDFSKECDFYFVTMTFPSESRRGVIAAPYPDFQQR